MEARDLILMTPLLAAAACAPDPFTCEDELANSSARDSVALHVSGIMDKKEDGVSTYTVTAVPDGDLGGRPDCTIIPEVGEPWPAEVNSASPDGAPTEFIISADLDLSKVNSAELWCYTNNDCTEHTPWMTLNDEGEYEESPYLVLPQ